MFKRFRKSGKDDNRIARLNSPLDAVRIDALSRITHDRAVTLPDDLLTKLVRDRSRRIRELALEYCQWHRPVGHGNFLVAALADTDRGIRWKAVRHLSQFPTPAAAAPLRRMFERESRKTSRCEDSQITMWIIMALGKCDDGQTAPFLFDLLTRTPLNPCAWGAGDSLGRLNPVAYLDSLIELLSSPEPHRVAGAVAALGGLGDPRATQPLLAVLAAQLSNPAFSLLTLMIALKNIHDPRMIDPLLGYLLEKPDTTFGIQGWVMTILAQYPEAQVIETILPYLTAESPDLRASAVNALTAIGGAAVTGHILAAFERETHPRISLVFVRALARLNDPRAIPLLQQRRAGADPQLLAEIDEAIAALKDA